MENVFQFFLFRPQFLRLEKFPSDDSTRLFYRLYMHERSVPMAYRMDFDLSLPNYLTSFLPLVSF